jgi:serine/threonine-protein kinase
MPPSRIPRMTLPVPGHEPWGGAAAREVTARLPSPSIGGTVPIRGPVSVPTPNESRVDAHFDALLAPGALFDGRYVVERPLGRGGASRVVLAYEPSADRHVALKVLVPSAHTAPRTLERFEREGHAMAALATPHVVKVLAAHRHERGFPYLVMEYLEGEDLARYRERHGPLPHRIAVDFLLEACAGLSRAHAAGVVHRDLKPSNMFLVAGPDRGRPCLKLIDFGIAKVVTGERITHTSEVFGSPEYMSPEQVRASSDVDARSDVWSLGVCLFELLAGRVPFSGESVLEAGSRILFERPPSLLELCPEAPPELVAVVERCLEKSPARRFSSVDDLARALTAFGSKAARTASRPRLAAVTTAKTVTTEVPVTEVPFMARRSTVRASYVLLALAVVTFAWSVGRVIVSPAEARSSAASAPSAP